MTISFAFGNENLIKFNLQMKHFLYQKLGQFDLFSIKNDLNIDLNLLNFFLIQNLIKFEKNFV